MSAGLEYGEAEVTEPEWYGPYLKEAERYNLPRTKENVDKACQEAGGGYVFSIRKPFF